MIGVTIAELNGDKVEKLGVVPVIPNRPNGKDFGFTTKNPKAITMRDGKRMRVYLKKGEVIISKREANERASMIKNESHTMLLKDIGRMLGSILFSVSPDVIIIERNETFGGILTTKLLAEIAGGIYFWSGFYDIDMYSYNVGRMRSALNRCVRGVDLKTDDGKLIVDTKMVVKKKLEKLIEDEKWNVHGWENATLDESDSFLAFVYYYMTEIRRDSEWKNN